MKHKTIKIKPISLALLLAGIGLAPAAFAANLVAIAGQWSPDGGTTQIPMWGFATDSGQACGSLPTWNVGPQLTDTDLVAGDLTINLRNCLGEGVSLVIPGKPATSINGVDCDSVGVPCAPVIKTNFFDPDGNPDNRPRVTAFTTEAPAGGAVTYTWTGISDGTYLYQSGSHPAKQVQMGLYGALTIKGTSYPDSHDEVTLLYSEIDPELHTTPTAATPLGYHPRHYLVNGSTSASFPTAGDTNHPTLLRFLNAGLDFHVPTLNSSYMSLVAEDGNAYPFPKRQYSANLAAGKTIDALWHAPAEGDYVIYDRRGNGMVASLSVAAGPDQPIAVDDSRGLLEDTVRRVGRMAVYQNDTLADGTPLNTSVPIPINAASREDVFLSVPSNGTVVRTKASCTDISAPCFSAWDYTPNLDFNGEDTFTYKFRVNDGTGWTSWSNVATITMNVNPVNDAPVADANGPYTATDGVSVTLDGTGSSDIDGDPLTYAWDFDYDGSSFIPTGAGAMPVTTYATGSYTVALVVSDGTAFSPLAMTTVEVTVAVNAPPIALDDDFPITQRNTAIVIDVTANDSDPDGNLDPGSIIITTGGFATRGGTVSVVTNGVEFTPKKNFRGTDTFNYTVADLDGAVSNEATVRVNVVK
jgi:FtsP/CotA-like multicopper oxidase with cupredoxin domain